MILYLALRYRQDSYRHIIETVPSTNQPSRANQQYPPPNLWQPNDSTSQQPSFIQGIQRPFPALVPSISQQQLTNVNSIGMQTSTSSYLTNYPNINQTNTTTYIDDSTNLNRHFDSNITSVDLSVPTQFQTTPNLTNSYFSSQRIHTSPSATSSFPQLYSYVQPSFNHHHHHLSSTIDDASLLIQNPSLT